MIAAGAILAYSAFACWVSHMKYQSGGMAALGLEILWGRDEVQHRIRTSPVPRRQFAFAQEK